MENQTESSQKEEESFVSRAVVVMEYVNSQRIFLIGKPLKEQFNQLICGYGQPDFKATFEDKIKPDKLKIRHENASTQYFSYFGMWLYRKM